LAGGLWIAEDIRVLRFRLMVMTKALDPNRPIREADISCCLSDVRFVPILLQKSVAGFFGQ
jgi:hypothetical protein